MRSTGNYFESSLSRCKIHGVGSTERPVIKSGHHHKSFTSTHYLAIAVWSAERSLYSEFNYGGREIEIERFSHSKLSNETKKMLHFNYISVDCYNLIAWFSSKSLVFLLCFFFFFWNAYQSLHVWVCLSVHTFHFAKLYSVVSVSPECVRLRAHLNKLAKCCD